MRLNCPTNLYLFEVFSPKSRRVEENAERRWSQCEWWFIGRKKRRNRSKRVLAQEKELPMPEARLCDEKSKIPTLRWADFFAPQNSSIQAKRNRSAVRRRGWNEKGRRKQGKAKRSRRWRRGAGMKKWAWVCGPEVQKANKSRLRAREQWRRSRAQYEQEEEKKEKNEKW